MLEMPVIDEEKCDGCGLCVSVCSRNALTLVNKVIVIAKTKECDWCTQCEIVCPTGAISCAFEIVLEEASA